MLLATVACFAILAVVWRLRPPASLAARSIAFVGEASLAIYVMHSIVIAALRAVLAKSGVLDETLLLVLGTILGIVLPAAF